MSKTEIKSLARYMSGFYLRELAENNDVLETGLEIRNVCLEDEEKQQLIQYTQEIINRLMK